jgi:hypothetical protein
VHRRRHVVHEVTPQIQVEEEAEAETEQRSDDRDLDQRSEDGALTEQTTTDEQGVGRWAAARPAAQWEQPDAAGPMASARASGWR